MLPHMRSVVGIVEDVFDRYLKANDRAALIKYARNCRLMFPLTRKCRNTA